METILLNTKNSKTNEPHRFRLNLADKLNLKYHNKNMELLGSTKKDVDQDKDGEDMPKLQSVEVVLVQCNLDNSSYQQASKVLLTFVPRK